MLLIEDRRRLIAVDAGIGHEGIRAPQSRLGERWLAKVRPALDPTETLRARLAGFGLDPRDLTDVVLTHHHRDHVDGLADFPWVRVHASARCRAVVTEGGDAGLVPSQWNHGVVWAPEPSRHADWNGFAVSRLDGLPETIRLVDLAGHSAGHCGVLIAPAHGPRVLHVGDAIHHYDQFTGEATPGLETFARGSRYDETARVETIERLAAIAASGDVRVVNSHDPGPFGR